MTTLSIAQQALSHSHNEINVMATLQLWMDRRAQRKQLAQLSISQLNDIGISYNAAQAEASKPFWK